MEVIHKKKYEHLVVCSSSPWSSPSGLKLPGQLASSDPSSCVHPVLSGIETLHHTLHIEIAFQGTLDL